MASDEEKSGDEGDTATWNHEIVYVPDATGFVRFSQQYRLILEDAHYEEN